MKKMKKILAMLLALTMVLGMGLTSMAEEDTANKTTITVEGSGLDLEDAWVKYQQVIVADTEVETGWKFVNSTYAGYFHTAFDVSTDTGAIEALIELGALENYNDYANAGNINVSATQLAAAIANVETGNPAKEVAGVWTISDATAGLYVINADASGYSYVPMAAYVGYTYNDSGEITGVQAVNVTAKGSDEQITKSITEDDWSVKPGDTVNYEVNVEYPFYPADYSTKKFEIKDTLTNGQFTGIDDVKVVVDNNTVVKNTDYTVYLNNEKTEMTITFTYNANCAGENVKVSYVVTAGDVSVKNNLQNVVVSTTVDIETGADKTTSATIISDTVSFTVTKYDDGTEATHKTLQGAEFTLYMEVTKEEAVTTGEDSKETVNKGYAKLTYGDSVVYAKVVEVVETDENGQIVYDGLDAQEKYYVAETKAPVGYKIDKTVHLVTGGASKDTEVNGTVTTYLYDEFSGQSYTNTKLSALPSTGGIGTTIFTVAGCGIMIAAAYFFFASRKKENN